MTKYLPKWLLEKYSILWRKFHTAIFDFKAATEALGYKDKRYSSKVLSQLSKAQWLYIDRDPIDRRKKIYKLRSPNEVMEQLEFPSFKEYKIRKVSERELQRKVASLFIQHGIHYIRGARFENGLKPDFLIPKERKLLELETEYYLSKGRQYLQYKELANAINFEFILMTEKRIVEGDLGNLSFLSEVFLEYR